MSKLKFANSSYEEYGVYMTHGKSSEENWYVKTPEGTIGPLSDQEKANKRLKSILDDKRKLWGDVLKMEDSDIEKELKFSSKTEALQHLADLTGKSIRISSSNELVKIFMERDEMTQQEANEYVKELKERVADGEDPEEVLHDEGLEPDYIFDLI